MSPLAADRVTHAASRVARNRDCEAGITCVNTLTPRVQGVFVPANVVAEPRLRTGCNPLGCNQPRLCDVLPGDTRCRL